MLQAFSREARACSIRPGRRVAGERRGPERLGRDCRPGCRRGPTAGTRAAPGSRSAFAGSTWRPTSRCPHRDAARREPDRDVRVPRVGRGSRRGHQSRAGRAPQVVAARAGGGGWRRGRCARARIVVPLHVTRSREWPIPPPSRGGSTCLAGWNIVRRWTVGCCCVEHRRSRRLLAVGDYHGLVTGLDAASSRVAATSARACPLPQRFDSAGGCGPAAGTRRGSGADLAPEAHSPPMVSASELTRGKATRREAGTHGWKGDMTLRMRPASAHSRVTVTVGRPDDSPGPASGCTRSPRLPRAVPKCHHVENEPMHESRVVTPRRRGHLALPRCPAGTRAPPRMGRRSGDSAGVRLVDTLDTLEAGRRPHALGSALAVDRRGRGAGVQVRPDPQVSRMNDCRHPGGDGAACSSAAYERRRQVPHGAAGKGHRAGLACAR